MSLYCKDCGSESGISQNYSISPLRPLVPGLILKNRYRIINLIKAGGMGAVYKVFDMKLECVCAVKELLPPYGTEEEQNQATTWFKREAKLLAGLDHSSLPKVFDYFVSNEKYYLIMSFIDGEDLESKLNREGNPGLEEEKVLKWAIEILVVLKYLHNHKPTIIYRDLKPSNIMLHKDGRVMLVDFGIARSIHQGSRSKKTIVGTGGYAPVEQCMGKSEPRSDIYALGATMHHLLTGIEPLPFRFEPVKKIIETVSTEADFIIMKALKDNINERFISSDEMLNFMIGGEKYIVNFEKKKEEITGEKKLKIEIIWDFETTNDITSSPIISEGLIFFGSDKLYCVEKKEGVKIWDFETGSTISSMPSAQGKFVYCINNDNKFYCLSAESGEKIWEFKTGSWSCGMANSSPFIENDLIYFGSSDYRLYCIEKEFGTKQWSFKTDDAVQSSPLISEGMVYFGSNDRKLYCLNAKNGKKIWEFKTDKSVKGDPLVSNGMVYLGSNDRKLYCLNAKNGCKIWEFKTGDKIMTRPAIDENKIYFGSSDYKLYCLNLLAQSA